MSTRDKAEIVSIVVGVFLGGFVGFLLGRVKIWAKAAEVSHPILLHERLRLRGLVK